MASPTNRSGSGASDRRGELSYVAIGSMLLVREKRWVEDDTLCFRTLGPFCNSLAIRLVVCAQYNQDGCVSLSTQRINFHLCTYGLLAIFQLA